MIKTIIFLFIFFFFYSLNTYSQEKDFVEPYLAPNNIEWSNKAIPKDVLISKSFLQWKKRSVFTSLDSLRWASVSLISTNSKEIIIQEMVGGSGGLGTLVLQKKGNQWTTLVEIFGGFIFQKVPSSNNSLVIYSRVGLDQSRTQYELVQGKYVQKSQEEFREDLEKPRALDKKLVSPYQYFWYLNEGFVGKK